MHVEQWLENVPPLVVHLVVAVLVGAESVGVPLPGETALIAGALMASQHDGVDPVVLAACAAVGAIVGDSAGYAIGRRHGRALLGRLEARFPRHMGPERLGAAERTMQRYGARAVFFGRFVALLRLLAGPLAGVLHMPYGRFLAANAAGGVVWAAAITAVVYYLGKAAEAWIERFSWAGLAVLAVLAVVLGALYVRRRHGREVHGP